MNSEFIYIFDEDFRHRGIVYIQNNHRSFEQLICVHIGFIQLTAF